MPTILVYLSKSGDQKLQDYGGMISAEKIEYKERMVILTLCTGRTIVLRFEDIHHVEE